jgi:hypothetical protein
MSSRVKYVVVREIDTNLLKVEGKFTQYQYDDALHCLKVAKTFHKNNVSRIVEVLDE